MTDMVLGTEIPESLLDDPVALLLDRIMDAKLDIEDAKLNHDEAVAFIYRVKHRHAMYDAMDKHHRLERNLINAMLSDPMYMNFVTVDYHGLKNEITRQIEQAKLEESE